MKKGRKRRKLPEVDDFRKAVKVHKDWTCYSCTGLIRKGRVCWRVPGYTDAGYSGTVRLCVNCKIWLASCKRDGIDPEPIPRWHS